MEQIKEHKDLVGKTIAQVVYPKENYQDMWIRFTDGSFVVLDIEDRTEGFGQTQEVIRIYPWDKDITDDELVKLGLITPQMHTNAVEERERRWADERKERQKVEDERIKEEEIKLLEKLKNKYD
jgi:hypothetical protein